MGVPTFHGEAGEFFFKKGGKNLQNEAPFAPFQNREEYGDIDFSNAFDEFPFNG